jgi:hypothetical protein
VSLDLGQWLTVGSQRHRAVAEGNISSGDPVVPKTLGQVFLKLVNNHFKLQLSLFHPIKFRLSTTAIY